MHCKTFEKCMKNIYRITQNKEHITQYRASRIPVCNSRVGEFTRWEFRRWGVEEKKSSADGEFRTWRVHGMGSSADRELRRWDMRRWEVQQM